MKKLFVFVVAVLAILFSAHLYAFASNGKAGENRQLKGFERIRLVGSPDIKYIQGKTWSVRVKAPQKVMKKVETRVEGNCLVVSMKDHSIFSLKTIKGGEVTVYVTSPDLIGVEVNGSGDFESKGQVDTDNLDIRLKGSGDIVFDEVICDAVKTSLVGSGDVEIKNVTTQYSSVELVGSGDVKMNQKHARKTQLELKGSGDIKVHSDQCGIIDCRLVGSGDITLTGSAKKLTQTIRGSGDIERKGLIIK